jgi:hypothetical protein
VVGCDRGERHKQSLDMLQKMEVPIFNNYLKFTWNCDLFLYIVGAGGAATIVFAFIAS